MSSSSMQTQQESSYLAAGNADYIEELYEQYLKNASSVSPEWQAYFKQLTNGLSEPSHLAVKEYFCS